MRTLVHVSDIHFGMTDDAVIRGLEAVCGELRPDAVVISGDLTQRAKVRQYEEARAFIKRLRAVASTVIAVPGNHDIAPYYRPIARVLSPYSRYDEYVAPDVEDRYVDTEIAICGMTTAQPSRIKDGRISRTDVDEACEWFRRHDAPVNVVVTHHPIALPRGSGSRSIAEGGEDAVTAFEQVPVDIYLSGHLHQSSFAQTSERHVRTLHDALAIQAGTVSTRSRGEVQSFNLLRIDAERVEVRAYTWDHASAAFVHRSAREFVRGENGWLASE